MNKLKSRTEWQAFLVSIAVLFANRFLDLGLTDDDLWKMVTATTGYAVSRGLAKNEG